MAEHWGYYTRNRQRGVVALMGEQYGKYELLRRIGVGGMAEVFVAETHGAEGFHKSVVIKRILPAFSQDPEFVRMFINEAHLAARLQHANVVQIFDFDHLNDTYYIAMEWVDGADLRRVSAVSERRKMPIPQPLAVHVGVETLKGLHYAHTLAERGKPLGLVHRDISPHNLLVSFSGEVKVADFGIAKAAALASLTKTGVVKGKLPYMAPEQLVAGVVDQRSDLFSLGLVLWELVRGRRPYHDVDSEGALLEAVRRGVVPSLAGFAGVPAALSRAVDKLAAADPERRYQSAAEALADFSELATVGDSLAAADYLKRLLPAEGERLLRGATAVVAQEPFEEATAGAATRTRPSTADLKPEAEVIAPAAGLALGEAVVASSDPISSQSVLASRTGPLEPDVLPLRPGRRLAPLVAIALVVLVGFAGGWLLVGSRGGGSAEQGAAAANEMVRVTIESEPPGASLWVDGVRLVGPAPQRITAVAGRRLRLRAQHGTHTVKRELYPGPGGGRTVLRLGPERPLADAGARVDAATGTRPSAGRSRSEPKKAKRRGKRLTGKRRRPRVTSAKEWGKLDVIVAPWASVKVDGSKVGTTPIRGHRLSAGRHRLEVANPEIGRRERIKIRIQRDETLTIRRNWSQ